MVNFTKYDRFLVLAFVLTLPLINPWVRGDGVGYYAFGRSLLIEHRLNFEKDWLAANTSFRMARVDAAGHILPDQYTATGRLDNHFAVGPAILWSPFLITAHLGVLCYDALGGHIDASGYSEPYVVAMAFGTAFYGFLSLWISFRLARKYFAERWAFLATGGIWFASSLPVYMYFNPSWSHAHSAFAVALFVWYWERTRGGRTWIQWIILGAIAGLMMNVYYPNGILLLFPLLDSLDGYWSALHAPGTERVARLFLKNLLFAGLTLVGFLPTLITKKFIYGGYLKFGYTERWFWNSPAILKVCFSAEHGLFTWTPILALSFVGLFLLLRHDRNLSLYSIAVFSAFLYAIGCYEDWHGIASFGNRFFISLTCLFILGLAGFFSWFAQTWRERSAAIVASGATAILVLWNIGLIYQWGCHLIPVRGPISWREAAYNQVAVVPERITRTLVSYLRHRKSLMDQIERDDVNQLKFGQPEGTE